MSRVAKFIIAEEIFKKQNSFPLKSSSFDLFFLEIYMIHVDEMLLICKEPGKNFKFPVLSRYIKPKRTSYA